MTHAELLEKRKKTVLRYCENFKKPCQDCPIKPFFPECGRGWHVGYDGTYNQVEAAMLFIRGKTYLEMEEEK